MVLTYIPEHFISLQDPSAHLKNNWGTLRTSVYVYYIYIFYNRTWNWKMFKNS